MFSIVLLFEFSFCQAMKKGVLFCVFNIKNITENNASKMDEMRRKREERKLQRQREMEARRNARGQGPMKLGTKLSAPAHF